MDTNFRQMTVIYTFACFEKKPAVTRRKNIKKKHL